MTRETIFSPDRVYRYTLWRQWQLGMFDTNKHPGYVQFIGMNPSTADETLDDPTIRRCIQFSKDWGYDEFCMTNVYAFRAKDPKVMKAQKYPIGDDNFHHLERIAKDAAIVVAAWGRDGEFIKEVTNHVKSLIRENASHELYHLGLNSDGSPKHPLYLRSDTKPTLWE